MKNEFDDLREKCLAVCEECVDLLIKKHKDYGRDNIARFGEAGIIIRSHDKQCRLNTFLEKGIMENESVEDAWRDKLNYSIIALLVRRGQW